MRLKESETLELKRSTSELKEGLETIVAILNKHHSGKLYFGIRNDGTVVGQSVTDKTLRDLSQAISNHIDPKIYPKIEKVKMEGADCILVEFEGEENIYYAYKKPFVRVGTENRQMDPKEIERIILRKGLQKEPWDGYPSKASKEDVNEKLLQEFIMRGNEAGRIDFRHQGLESTLNKLGLLLENGRLTNAGQILFCDDNHLEVQTAIFAGTDKLTFLDIHLLKGNLFHMLKETEIYLKSHMKWNVKFGKMERDEIPEVPIKALREAIVNSLCHRDYANPKGNEIAIFKDRIEIYNPGQFPEEYEPEDFIRGEERSILRNPLIANTIYLSKDIEKWGSGLKRIYDDCSAAGIKVEFKKIKSGFTVVFHRKLDVVEKTRVKTRVKTREKIVALIQQNPKITIKELADKTGITEKGIEWQLKELKSSGRLIRKGPPKGGHWEIIE